MKKKGRGVGALEPWRGEEEEETFDM